MKKSLCIIVKANHKEAKLLDRCLKSISKYVDEINITITGKNKEVEKVAKKYNAEISYFKWINDFAKARNFNFSKATGDWILWLDADDIVEGGQYLDKMIQLMDKEGVDTGIADYLYDFDRYGQCTVRHRKTRIVKNDGCTKWVGKLHEDLIEQRNIKAYLMENFQIIHRRTEERKLEAGKRNLEIALEQLSDDPKTIWDVANAYLQLNNFVEAISYYNKFIPLSGSDEEKFLAWHRMANALSELKQYDRAINAGLEALKLRPWYPDPYLAIGEIYYKQGKRKNAKEFLVQGLSKEVPKDTAIVWNPRDYDFNPLVVLSNVYFELNQPENAKKCLMECLKIYPKHEGVKNMIEVLDKEIVNLKKIDDICENIKKAKTKEEIGKLIDSAPDELRSHPKLVYLKNLHFIKTESSGKDLAIYCYFTEEPFDPDIIQKEGRGGSEEAVYHMSEELSKLGWNITVYANCGYKERKFGDVWWKPFWSFNPRDKQDVLVAWRNPALFEIKEVNTNKSYVWLHDIMKPQEFTVRRLNKIDKILPLSQWQRDLFPNIDDEKFMITANGLDVKRREVKRNPNRLIWSSSYDRGLETLLKLFPAIKKEVPKAELHIFYGWNLWDELYQDDKSMMELKKKINEMMQQPGVYHHGRVSQEQITEEYQKSSIWAYPTEFGEISCITAMKTQALGAIPITTNVAALDETVQFGLKVDSKDIYTDIDAQTEFVNGAVSVLKNPPTEKERKEMMDWAEKEFSWKKVALQWDKEFKSGKQESDDLEVVEMDRFDWIRGNCQKGEKIVDIGGNKGHTLKGWNNVTVVDMDLYDIPNFVQANAESLPFEDNSFDTAVLAEILEHVEDPVKAMKEAKRVASKVIITVPNEYEWKEGLGAFMSKENAAETQGLTVEEMVKRDNPAIKHYTKDKYKHIFHNRYYTRKMLEEHLEKAEIKNYKIAKLYTEGFAFLTVIAK